jgi:hypothetical protein
MIVRWAGDRGMRKKLAAAGLVVGLAAWPCAAGASGDSGCYPEWKLAAQQFSCANRMVIGPGNDSRVNLLLLLRDREGLDGQGLATFEPAWSSFGGHTLFEWDELIWSLYPAIAPVKGEEYASDASDFSPSRCQSVRSGGEQLLAAVERNRVIPAGDRRALTEGREKLTTICAIQAGQQADGEPVSVADLELPRLYASREGREFGTYLAGAAAFYLEDWNGARSRFAALRTAKDPWLVETARYMGARAELNAAGAPAFDEWGSFDLAAADKEAAARAASGFAAYLEAYPQGRYASSAAGLVRRALWLQGETEALGAAYARMLERVDPANPAAVDLVQEIDIKYLLDAGAAGGQSAAGPWLVAAHDLLRLRNDETVTGDVTGSYYYAYGLPLTAAELAAQAPAFTGHEELYGFIRANFAFYVERDYRAVLQLLPDDARKPSYSPLQFSRQVLRGMALAQLEDRNEQGFWLELIGGAKGLYQRQTVELGLALAWERAGEVAKVFAPQSPIEDRGIRDVLLQHAAGPEVLRSAAGLTGRPQGERDTALYVLLYKELARGSYAAALRDLAQVRADAPIEYSSEGDESQFLLGLYTRGRFSEDYACPALRETVAQLARDPRAVKARLCLGEFYRLNAFDYSPFDDAPTEGELGSFAAYPGDPVPRDRIYRDVIGEPGVSHEDRAYALYRAVYCYAPGRTNTCSREEVPESQRRAWFRRLKDEFGDTRWGREIEYYW